MTSFAWSQQSQDELEQKKAKLEEEIHQKELQLKEISSKEMSAVKQLEVQKEKIGLKEKLISTTEKQAKLLNDNMYNNQVKINHLNSDLNDLKKDYSEMIVKSYKSRSQQSRAMFLLSSENFLQAYKRLQYMKQYSSYRKMQGDEIKSKSIKLENYNNQLNVQKKAKQKLIAEQDKQKKDLEKDKKEQERIANSLKKSKKQVVAEIKKKQQESRKIDAQIQRMIREAIAEANRKAAAARAKANPKKTTVAETKAIESSTKIVLSPEGKIISDNFKANKGRLPWPVDNGTITLGYGRHIDSVYKLESNNSGIEITAQSGSSVRAVFSGEVTQVMVIGQKKGVVIKHGDYFTTYLNLTNISVSAGDKVSAKEVIGKIKTNSDGNTVLKFMIFQNTADVNPASWLTK